LWVLGAPSLGFAQTEPAAEPTAEPATEPSAELGVEPPLEALPAAPNLRLPDPTADDKKLLESLLTRLTQLGVSDAPSAPEILLRVDATLLPAIRARVDEEAERSQRGSMKELLLETRRQWKDEVKRTTRGGPEPETPDYLLMMLAAPKPEQAAWQQLVRVLALSRMCTRMGSVEAVRVLVHIYVRFEFLRIDTQLQLYQLADRALAGLIESTRHPAPVVSEWAKRRLDFLGKAIPSEVVQVQDAEVLADVLRAYGRTRDPDALRLIISFANSERTQVRLAARQAVSLLGEVANWPLRDTYENMVGKKPPRDWTWERTARELFRSFDQIRLAELYEHYRGGLQALARSDLKAMRLAFDKVLARNPDFEPRDKLAQGYLQYALAEYDTDPAGAELALQRVARIAPAVEQRNKAQSLVLTLAAKRLSEQRVADQFLLRQALQLDPQNPHAVALQAELAREPLTETSGFMRVLWPSLLAVLGIGFALFIALRRRPSSA
jgi:hypothetical protein